MYHFAIRSSVVLLLMQVMAAASFLVPGARAGDLQGTVVDEAGGPVAGAYVMISEGHLKKGKSAISSACHPDCQKSAVTDAAGAYVIADVDNELLFKLYVVKAGYAPAEIKDAESSAAPAASASVVLKNRSEEVQKGADMVRGRVLDRAGNPVPGAFIEPRCYWYSNGNSEAGAPPGDPCALTDGNGEFNLLVTRPNVRGVSVDGKAPDLAVKISPEIARNGPRVDMILDQGITIRGRVVRDEIGIARIPLSLISKDRTAENCVRGKFVQTDARGKFIFTNVPAKVAYQLNVPRENAEEIGVARTAEFTAGAPGEVVNLEDITLVTGKLFPGRIMMPGSDNAPDGLDVIVAPQNLWGFVRAPVGKDGRFSFRALPSEKVDLSVTVPGYILDPESNFFNAPSTVMKENTIHFEYITPLRVGPEAGNPNFLYIPLKRNTGIAQGKGANSVHVLSSDGKPVKGASVVVVPAYGGRDMIMVRSGKITLNAKAAEAVATDADGCFALEIPAKDACLLISSDTHGYLCVPVEEAKEKLTLKPWCTIKGTALWRDKPANGMTISLYQPFSYECPDKCMIMFIAETLTNPDGTFTFTNLPAGMSVLSRMKDRSMLDRVPVIAALNGDALKTDGGPLVLGKGGVSITGKIVLPKMGDINVRQVNLSMRITRDGSSRSQLRAGMAEPGKRRWWETPEGKASLKQDLEYTAYFDEDGTYHLENVEPGTYTISGGTSPKTPRTTPSKPLPYNEANKDIYFSLDSKIKLKVTEEQVREAKEIDGPTVNCVPATFRNGMEGN